MSDYITKSELEEFGKKLIEQLKDTEIEIKSNSNGQLLKPIYNKWFHCTMHSKEQNRDKPFKQHFDVPRVWKVWDSVRGLTCAVCGVRQVVAIKDTAFALDFCEKLCEFIDQYMIEAEKDMETSKGAVKE